MIVSISQPELFPFLPFFDKMDISDIFIILDNVQFKKGYFYNRFKIRDKKGTSQLLTLPLKKAPYQALITEREIAQDDKYFAKTINKIEDAYSKTPFFQKYFPKIKSLLYSHKNLSKLNSEIIFYFIQEFGIDCKIMFSSKMKAKMGVGGTLVNCELSKEVGATCYMSGRMGRAYLDEDYFRKAEISVVYHDYNINPYPQLLDHQFIPYLSTIDLLFNCGDESLSYIRKGRKVNL
jgi:hypothetical protein